MTSTYVNDLRLEEIGTGEQSGTWGATTNTNLELIAEAFGYGTEAITTNADTHTTTVADGATDPGRAMYIKYTGTLDSACTITIAPNTLCRVHFIENATSGSQNIIISQGSGANVTIPNGAVKMVYLDGAGSGAAVTDALIDLNLGGTLTVGVDDTGHDVKFFGATSGQYMLWDESADELVLAGDSKLSFHDAAGGENIIASSDGHLEINAGTTLDITAPTVDINASTAITLESDSITLGENGDTDVVLTFNGNTSDGVLTWMEDEDHFKFSDDIVIDSTKRLYLNDEGGEYIYGDGTDLNIVSGNDINIPANIGLTFGDDGEKIEGDGTDLTIAGNNINLTAVADVNIPINVGLTFATAEKIESDGTDLSITVGSGGDINIPANIGLTFGDDGEKIEGDGTDLTITGNNINLTAATDVIIPSGVGLILDGSGNEKIESDGTDISISVGSGGDINIPANIGVTFGDDGEKIEGDGTDLTITGNNINLTAATDVIIPANIGLTFGTGEKIEGDSTDLTITSGAKINLTANTDVVIPANIGLILDGSGDEKIESDGTDINISVGSNGDINIPSNIGLTFGDDGEKIEGDGTDLTISGNNINLTAAADVNIPINVGLTFATAEKIESDGTDLNITVGSGGDINIPANIGLTFGDDGEKIEGDGSDLTISGNSITLSGNTTVTGNFTVNGTTTTVNTTNLTVTDPLVKYGQTYTGTAYDQGFIVTRGNGSVTNQANRAFIWDESADEFVTANTNTEDGTTAGNVTIDDYANLHVGKITADDASVFNAITASGILKTDDTTEATTTTDGSLQTDGGLSVVKDAVFGDDVKLLSDDAVLSFGAGSDVTITHDPDDGLIFKSIATADNNPFLLTIQTGETDLAAADVIGKIQFQAPDEGTGTDAVLVSAAIQAIAEGDFSSSSNATSLQLMTGSSEAATAKVTVTSSGDVGIKTADPDGLLHLFEGGDTGGTAHADADTLILENDGNSGMTFLSSTGGKGTINFDDAGGNARGSIVFDHGTDDLTIDATDDIILDSDSANWRFKDNGTSILEIGSVSSGASFYNAVQDAYMYFKGNDADGGAFTALTLDMSDQGTATFNHDVKMGDLCYLILGAGNDLELVGDGTNGKIACANGNLTLDLAADLVVNADGGNLVFQDGSVNVGELANYHDGSSHTSDFVVAALTSNKDILFRGLDDSTTITALKLDISDLGKALFNSGLSITSNDMPNVAAASIYHDSSNRLRITGGTAGYLFMDDGNSTVQMFLDSSGDLRVGGGNSRTPFIQGGTNDGRVEGSPGYSFMDDANTGMFSPADDTIAFSTAGTERMRISSTGGVSIGSSANATGIHSNAKVLEISGGDGGDLIIGNNASTNIGAGAHIGAIAFKNIDTSPGTAPLYAGIRCESVDTSGNMDLRFYTGTANLESDSPQAMFNSAGTFLVGKTSSDGAVAGFEARADATVYATLSSGATYYLHDTSANKFYVNANGGIYNYQSNDSNLSDEREKKNIATLGSKWDAVKKWSLKEFHYNADADSDSKKVGVIAQDLESDHPDLVTEFDLTETTKRKAVKEQQITWMAIKALQEAMAKIETLEAKVAALEGS